jgi:LeuA allosteric (dimerisation) domain
MTCFVGTGPVDAAYKAIVSIVQVSFLILSFSIQFSPKKALVY